MSKKIVLTMVVVSAVSFATGRYTVPGKETSEKVSTTVKADVVDLKKQERLKIVKREVTKTNGSKVVTTITTNDVDTSKTVDKSDIKHATDKTERVSDSSKVTISALGAIDPTTKTPTYGASITKPVLGPVTLGFFGLSNGTLGASIGLTF